MADDIAERPRAVYQAGRPIEGRSLRKPEVEAWARAAIDQGLAACAALPAFADAVPERQPDAA